MVRITALSRLLPALNTAERTFYKNLSSYRVAIVGKRIHPNQIRFQMKALGFISIDTYPNHTAATSTKLTQPYTHVLFDAREDELKMTYFVEKMLENNKGVVMVAISEEPRIDNVFQLIQKGARGFLVPPLNLETTELVLLQATNGPPFSELILTAERRNQAFAEVILNNLYRVSVALRHSREHNLPFEAIRKLNTALQESIEMAMMFCEFDEKDLKQCIFEACIRRADDERTRLGKLRKSLRQKRATGEGAPEESPSA
ncbi:MAG: hypothetical protein KDD69_16335 [Bdellovibrionales bacterium]|nr:hypothetical protein [Bdellovibrionales bacterium]